MTPEDGRTTAMPFQTSYTRSVGTRVISIGFGVNTNGDTAHAGGDGDRISGPQIFEHRPHAVQRDDSSCPDREDLGPAVGRSNAQLGVSGLKYASAD
jgi:uncharacterized Zn-binding protein involved in type VI secretion